MATAAVRTGARGKLPGGPETRFALGFAGLTALFALVYAVSHLEPLLVAATAHLTEWASNAVGQSAAVLAGPAAARPVAFSGGAFSYQITSICTGATLGILYAAAVVAFPATWRQRTVGLAAGIPVIGVLNIIRLVLLGWVGLHARSLFDQIHLYWYQAFLILAAGLGWFAWATLVAEGGRLKTTTRDRLRSIASAVGLFVSTFVLLIVAGAVLNAPNAYGRLLSWTVFVTGGLIYQDSNVHVQIVGGAALATSATLVAVIALFVAVPSVSRERRLRTLFRRGIPATLGVHVVATLAQYAIVRSHPAGASLLSEAVALAGTVVPLTVWFTWVRAEWVQETRQRRQRVNARPT